MTVWFASERTLNVVIIWLQVIDYQKINALNFSQKSVLDRLLHMLIKIFIHFEKIFFWEDFLLRRIFFKEDSLSKRFRFLWKRFQFLSRKFQFLLRRFSFKEICHFCSLQKQNWGHHMPEPCCPSWIFWFLSRRFRFLSRKFWFL